MPPSPELRGVRLWTATICAIGSVAVLANEYSHVNTASHIKYHEVALKVERPSLSEEGSLLHSLPNRISNIDRAFVGFEVNIDRNNTANTKAANSIEAFDPGYASYPPNSDFYILAKCESSSTWDIDTNNGYYGGVQEDMTFWRTYGGLSFASSPNLATPEQQIVVARRGYYGQSADGGIRGWTPWPVCAPKEGL